MHSSFQHCSNRSSSIACVKQDLLLLVRQAVKRLPPTQH